MNAVELSTVNSWTFGEPLVLLFQPESDDPETKCPPVGDHHAAGKLPSSAPPYPTPIWPEGPSTAPLAPAEASARGWPTCCAGSSTILVIRSPRSWSHAGAADAEGRSDV